MMKIEVDFSRGSFGGKACNILGKHARSSVKDFFKHYDKPVERVDLMAFKASSGANPQALIRVCKAASKNFGHAPTGVPVVVFTEGTQGITCLMRIDDANDDAIREVIEQGPYNRKRNGKTDHLAGVTPNDQQTDGLGQYGFVVPHLSELLAAPSDAEASVLQTEQDTVKERLLELAQRFNI